MQFAVANYITKLRGLKREKQALWETYALFVANYITKLRGLKHTHKRDFARLKRVANYITKLRGLKRA